MKRKNLFLVLPLLLFVVLSGGVLVFGRAAALRLEAGRLEKAILEGREEDARRIRLALAGRGEDALAAARRLLNGPNWKVRWEAFRLLRETVPGGEAWLERERPIRDRVHFLLAFPAASREGQTSRIRRFGPAAVSPLEEILEDASADPGSRVAAVRGLAALGASTKGSVEALTRALRHPSGEVRATVAGALWRIEGDAGRALPVLREVVWERSDREGAARILGEMGEAGLDVAWEIAPLLDDADPLVRAAARDAASRIGKAGSAAGNSADHTRPQP